MNSISAMGCVVRVQADRSPNIFVFPSKLSRLSARLFIGTDTEETCYSLPDSSQAYCISLRITRLVDMAMRIRKCHRLVHFGRTRIGRVLVNLWKENPFVLVNDSALK